LKYPSPADPAFAPVWENYINAQAVQACLGRIPNNCRSVVLYIHDLSIALQFDMREVDDRDRQDMQAIRAELSQLLKDQRLVEVSEAFDTRPLAWDRCIYQEPT